MREPVTRSGTGFRGKHPSYKLKRLVHFESLLERDGFLVLDSLPMVLTYQEQPREDHYYTAEGKQLSYCCDVQVTMLDHAKELWEIKPSEIMLRQAQRTKYGLIAKRFDELDETFRIWDSDDIRREPRFSNAKLLFTNAKTASRPESNARLLHKLSGRTILQFGELSSQLNSDLAAYQLVKSMFFTFDVDAPLTASTLLRFNDQYGKYHGAL